MPNTTGYKPICDEPPVFTWSDNWVTCSGGLVCYWQVALDNDGQYSRCFRIKYHINRYGFIKSLKISFPKVITQDEKGNYLDKRILRGMYHNLGERHPN